MKKSVLGVVGCAAALFAVAGCTPEARQDVGQAGDNLNQAAAKSAQGTAEATEKAAAKTGEAVSNAADATADAAKGAVVATKDAAKDAAEATEKAAAKTGAAVADATKDAAQATEKAAAKTGAAVAGAGDTLALTPKVKNALLLDDSIKIDSMNVDTVAADKTVTLSGTAASADVKTKAESIAKKALADAKSDYKFVSKLTVAGGASGGKMSGSKMSGKK